MKILFIALMMLVGTWCMAEDEESDIPWYKRQNDLQPVKMHYTPIQTPKLTTYNDSYTQVGNTVYHQGSSMEYGGDDN